MSKNATYCNQLELSKLRDTTAEEERSADQGSRYSSLPEQSMAKLPPRRMWSARNEPEPIEETYEEINPAPGMQGFKNGGLDNEACYLSMKAVPPYPQQQAAGQRVTPDRKNATTLVRVKKAILIFGICIAALLLVSAGALALGVVNLIKQPKAPVSNIQVGAVGSNKTLLSNGDVEALTLRVSTLEASLSQLQARLDQQLNDTSVAIAQLSSRVEARMDSINTQLITTSMAINTQLTATMADIALLNTRVNTPIDLYSGCYKDAVTCRVAQHSSGNPYFYLCNTPFLVVNVMGFYTVNMQCLRDPDRLYLDTAYVEISNAHARCNCYVVGITSTGNHGSFTFAPTGDCHMVMTRCPTSRAIFTGV